MRWRFKAAEHFAVIELPSDDLHKTSIVDWLVCQDSSAIHFYWIPFRQKRELHNQKSGVGYSSRDELKFFHITLVRSRYQYSWSLREAWKEIKQSKRRKTKEDWENLQTIGTKKLKFHLIVEGARSWRVELQHSNRRWWCRQVGKQLGAATIRRVPDMAAATTTMATQCPPTSATVMEKMA